MNLKQLPISHPVYYAVRMREFLDSAKSDLKVLIQNCKGGHYNHNDYGGDYLHLSNIISKAPIAELILENNSIKYRTVMLGPQKNVIWEDSHWYELQDEEIFQIYQNLYKKVEDHERNDN